jgi:beta-lactamase regulating signal transducer with metallopeptidase domain/predicted  nucleic acid-binding Zn-ribbon protein
MAIILILLKASVLLTATLSGAWLLRAAPAAMRHTLWSVTFSALLALPLIGAAVPALHVPVPDRWTAAAPRDTPSEPGLKSRLPADAPPRADPMMPALKSRPTTDAALEATPQPAPQSGSVFDRRSIGALAWLVWLAGTLAAAGALLLSLLRVRRLTQRAADVTDPAWREAADTIGARLALRRPARVLMSGAVRTPMAGGVWRPVIFLPADAASWTAERRDVVLAHELSHIARRDPLRHLAARFAVACYWFHPLAWLAARQSSLAREQACDEAVLALGVRPSDYARVLLDLADTMAPSRRAATALLMVERSLLETRLMSILDHRPRPSRLRRPFVPAVSAALFALTLAAAQPAARNIDVRAPMPVTPTSSVTPAASPVAVAAPAIVPAAPQPRGDATCWVGGSDRDGFTGFTNTDSSGTILERVGTSGGHQIIQQRYGDVRICMLAQGDMADRSATPTTWAGRAPRFVIETLRGASAARLDIVRQAGAAQTTWRVNGAERPFDAAAQAWRDAVLAVLDRTWEISTLRGEASSLHGEISSLRGEESSLHGEISSLRGEISSLRGEQSSVRGEESMLRGEISEIQGHVSSLRGQISSERGSISALESSRYGLSSADRDRLTAELKAHEDEIRRLERELRDYDQNAHIAAVEKQIRALDADGKVKAIEDQIRTFDEPGKIAAIEKQIQGLGVNGRTADLERRIQALDVDRRTRQMQERLEDAIKQLEKALAGIK